jgi:hypothetical protein
MQLAAERLPAVGQYHRAIGQHSHQLPALCPPPLVEAASSAPRHAVQTGR